MYLPRVHALTHQFHCYLGNISSLLCLWIPATSILSSSAFQAKETITDNWSISKIWKTRKAFLIPGGAASFRKGSHIFALWCLNKWNSHSDEMVSAIWCTCYLLHLQQGEARSPALWHYCIYWPSSTPNPKGRGRLKRHLSSLNNNKKMMKNKKIFLKSSKYTMQQELLLGISKKRVGYPSKPEPPNSDSLFPWTFRGGNRT